LAACLCCISVSIKVQNAEEARGQKNRSQALQTRPSATRPHQAHASHNARTPCRGSHHKSRMQLRNAALFRRRRRPAARNRRSSAAEALRCRGKCDRKRMQAAAGSALRPRTDKGGIRHDAQMKCEMRGGLGRHTNLALTQRVRGMDVGRLQPSPPPSSPLSLSASPAPALPLPLSRPSTPQHGEPARHLSQLQATLHWHATNIREGMGPHAEAGGCVKVPRMGRSRWRQCK
jgi:hypothetical protein